MIRAARTVVAERPERPERPEATERAEATERTERGRRGRPGGPGGPDQGSVTVELALVLPLVVLLVGVVLATVGAGAVQLRCADAARTAARVAVTGADTSSVVAAGRRVAGPGAQVIVRHAPPWVEVEVRASTPLGRLLGGRLEVHGSAVGWVEP